MGTDYDYYIKRHIHHTWMNTPNDLKSMAMNGITIFGVPVIGNKVVPLSTNRALLDKLRYVEAENISFTLAVDGQRKRRVVGNWLDVQEVVEYFVIKS